MADSRSNRSILLDNTTGIIYTNITDVSLASQATTLGQIALKGKSSTIKSAGAAVQIVTDPVGSYWSSTGLLTKVYATLTGKTGASSTAAAPTGQALNMRFRKKTNGVITTLSPTLSISAGSTTSAITTVSWSFIAGDYLYSDVTQIGSISPGYGLVVYFSYY
jgi:hypothetical protein